MPQHWCGNPHPRARPSPGPASGGPVFFASWPKKTGEKKGRFPLRKLSRQPSYRSARCLLFGALEGFDCRSFPAPALARLRAGCAAPSAFARLLCERTSCVLFMNKAANGGHGRAGDSQYQVPAESASSPPEHGFLDGGLAAEDVVELSRVLAAAVLQPHPHHRRDPQDKKRPVVGQLRL